MEISEEKKAIEYFKNKYWYIDNEEDEKNVKTLLNLIEKQDNKIKFFIENEIVLKEMNRNQMKIIEKQEKLINIFIHNEAVKEGKDFNEIKEKYYECL